MHTHSLHAWQHGHAFLGERHERNERRTWIVVGLTTVMMVAEILGGWIYGSMALIADGWHMSTHAGALAIAALSYRFARRHAADPRFSFGTGKVGELAGYSSAVLLALIALLIGYESLLRVFIPVPIRFDQAIAIAVLGLAVNLASAWLLREGHGDEHHHHGDDHHHRHADHNLRAAYLHVLADALTSVLAIVSLLAGRFYGWVWMDPLMAIVGAGVIAALSWGLLRSSGAVLLDVVPDAKIAVRIRERMEVGQDRIADLHLWRVGLVTPRRSSRWFPISPSRRQPTNLVSRDSPAFPTSPSKCTAANDSKAGTTALLASIRHAASSLWHRSRNRIQPFGLHQRE